jgi:hypothetical protein
MDDSDKFLFTADEWLVSYSIPPTLPTVKLFSIGHSIELYLKAANTMITGNKDHAISFRHEIKIIWDDCKSKDTNFMPSYEIRDSVFNSDFIHKQAQDLSRDDMEHFLRNEEFYIIAKHLPGLKYYGVPPKPMEGMVFFVEFPNPYWIGFLKELRKYLNHPKPNEFDFITITINQKILPNESVVFLNQLYT